MWFSLKTTRLGPVFTIFSHRNFRPNQAPTNPDKPRQTPTNPDELRRTPTNSTSNQVFKGAHCFQSEWQKILAFRPTLGSFANFQNQQRQSSFSWLNIGFLGLQLQILFVLKNTAQNCKYQLEINESVVQAGMIKL